MIPPVSYAPKIWDLLSKVQPIQPKAAQRLKKSSNQSDSSKAQPKLSDPVLGKFIDIKV